MLNKKNQINTGSAMMLTVLFLMSFSLIVVYGIATPVLKEVQAVSKAGQSRQSFFASESGVEDAMYRVKTNKQIDSTETFSVGSINVVTSINDIDTDTKEIVSIGNIASNIRKTSTNVSTASGIDFFYGVQTGDGGVEMDIGSRIEGVGTAVGNIYSNGSIEGASGATITGSATVSGGLTEDIGAQSLVCNVDNIVGQSNPKIDYAQSFTPSNTGSLAQISLYIKKIGSPKDRDIRITADDNGKPNNHEIGKEKLKGSLVGESYSWINVPFKNPVSLTQGETYWIVFDAKKENNKYWEWCSGSSSAYVNGQAKYSKNWKEDSWSDISGDLSFKTFFGAGSTVLNNVIVNGDARANSITNSTIDGDAYYKSISGSTVGGTSYPGSDDPVTIGFPISNANITEWKNDAGCGQQPAIGLCNLGGSEYEIKNDTTIGPGTIDGDLEIEDNNVTVTLSGTLYVKGNVKLDNNTIIKCDTSYGSKSCLLIADGTIHVDNGSSFQGSGTNGSYFMGLTLSGCNGLGGGTNCTHHNGAVDIHNNASGAIWYAPDGMVNLHNNADVTQVTAYRLRLDNNASIRYENGVVDLSFSSGPSGTWKVNNWAESE